METRHRLHTNVIYLRCHPQRCCSMGGLFFSVCSRLNRKDRYRVASSCGICCWYQQQGPRFNVKTLSCKCGQLHVPSLSISMVTDCHPQSPVSMSAWHLSYIAAMGNSMLKERRPIGRIFFKHAVVCGDGTSLYYRYKDAVLLV